MNLTELIFRLNFVFVSNQIYRDNNQEKTLNVNNKIPQTISAPFPGLFW